MSTDMQWTDEDAGAIELAHDILEECRVRLMMLFRFMDRALWKMPLVPGKCLQTLSTDGKIVEFNPWLVIDAFEANPNELTRDMLHCILHCVFRHPFDASHAFHDAWWLACDVSIELLAAQMCADCCACSDDETRLNYAAHLEKQIGTVTAPNLYRVFQAELQAQAAEGDSSQGFSYLDDIKELYLRDDHGKWPKNSQDAPEEKAGKGGEEESPDQGQGAESDHGDINDALPDQPADSSSAEGTSAEAGEASEGDGSDQPVEGSSSLEKENSESAPEEDVEQLGQPDRFESTDSSELQDSSASPEQNTESQEEISPEEWHEDVSAEWETISKQMEVDLDMAASGKRGAASSLHALLSLANRKKYDYRAFLKLFALQQEELVVNDDEFDYIFYTFGLRRYGNMPIIEPLEYRDAPTISTLIIALDTSGSTAGETVKAFVQSTLSILVDSGYFQSEMDVRIIQCDAEIQSEQIIRSVSDIQSFGSSFEVLGMGGTDFRPVFEYVNELVSEGQLEDVQGLLYFTDGQGTYPATAPDYKTAFIFLEDNGAFRSVPPWAIKIMMTSDEVCNI